MGEHRRNCDTIFDCYIDAWREWMTLWSKSFGMSLPFGRGWSDDAERIVVVGKLNESPTGTFRVHNREFRRVRVRVSLASSLKDKKDEEVSTTVKVEPAEFHLEPWQSRDVKVRADIDEELRVGEDYSVKLEAFTQTQSANVTVRRLS